MAAFPIGIRIRAHEYEDFLRAIPDDKHLPATYDEYLTRRLSESQRLLMKGGRLKEVAVDYKGFEQYCRDAKRKPSYVMLMSYAVTKSIE